MRVLSVVLFAAAIPVFLPTQPVTPAKATAVLAGGCFWGVEAVYEHVRGVKSVVSGFAVPISGEATMKPAKGDYVEAVRIEYDPTQLSYSQVLQIFFSVAHDPTQVDRQGPDVGPEYRSVILTDDSTERSTARQLMDSLTAAQIFTRPLATQISGLKTFKVAEDFHQDYVARNPREPYVMINDAPKLEHLRQLYPNLYRDR